MKVVFADTSFWIARANPNDHWALAARQTEEALGSALIVTTDEVLTEFLNGLAKVAFQRPTASRFVHAVLQNPNVRVIPQSRDSFLEGIGLYESRPDKRYRLTDCISMCVMKEQGIQEVLTNDHHFEQEGFAVLIRERK